MTFDEQAVEYLDPLVREPTFTDEIDADMAREAEAQAEEMANATVAQLPPNVPTPDIYDYKAGAMEQFQFKDDDGVVLPNRFVRPGNVNIAGWDLTTGEKHYNTYEDDLGYVNQAVAELKASRLNSNHGPATEDIKSLSKIAYAAAREGKDYEAYMSSVPDTWSREQKQAAWQAGMAADIRDRYENGEIDLDILPTLDGPSFEGSFTEDELRTHEGWLKDAGTFYAYVEGESFHGDPDDLHNWAVKRMSMLNHPTWGANIVARSWMAPEEVKRAIYRTMTVYQHTDLSLAQVGRGLAYGLTEPTNYLVLAPGVGAGARAAVEGTKRAVVSKFRNFLAHAMLATKVGMIEGGIYAGLDDFYRQSVEMGAGMQEGYDVKRGATATGVGTAAGGAFGFGVGASMSPQTIELGKKLIREGKKHYDQ
jgi:hypothetical protein